MAYSNQSLKMSFIEWVKSLSFTNPIAITMGMRLAEPLRYSRCLRHFSNRLNQKVFGNGFRRFGERFGMIAVREGDAYPHYHLILDNHSHLTTQQLTEKVRDEWSKTDLGLADYVDVKEMHSVGWISYISKHQSKAIYDESIDWDNIVIR